jgi:hypothetical protein
LADMACDAQAFRAAAQDMGADPAPFVPSFISRVRSPYAPAWGGLQKLLG